MQREGERSMAGANVRNPRQGHGRCGERPSRGIPLIPPNPAESRLEIFLARLGAGHCARRTAEPDRDSAINYGLGARSARPLRHVAMPHERWAQCR